MNNSYYRKLKQNRKNHIVWRQCTLSLRKRNIELKKIINELVEFYSYKIKYGNVGWAISVPKIKYLSIGLKESEMLEKALIKKFPKFDFIVNFLYVSTQKHVIWKLKEESND